MTVEEIRNKRLSILETIERLEEENNTMEKWELVKDKINELINEDKILKQELEKKIETKQFKATS